MKNLKIAIIGSGISGLTAAAFLHKDEHEVTIFEKFTSPKPVGAGLMMQPTGLACLAQLGLDEKVIAYGAKVEHLYGKSATGKTIFDISYHMLAKHIFGLGIHRASLFKVLFDEVKEKVAFTNKSEISESLIEKDKRVIKDAANNIFGPFDLVIDASGMHSILRQKYGTIKLNKPYPYGAIWGVCEDKDQNFAGHILQQRYDAAKIMIGVLPIGKAPNSSCEYIAFFWSLPTNAYEDWKKAGIEVWKEKVLSYWPELDQFLRQFKNIDDLTFAQYGDIVLKKWHTDRLVFIGDAAHCNSPQLGQGANLGIIDAMTLAKILQSATNVNEALEIYSKKRRSQINFYQTASRWLTPFFQSDSAFAAWLRDNTFELMCKTPYLRSEMMRTLSGMKNGLFTHVNPGIWNEAYDISKDFSKS